MTVKSIQIIVYDAIRTGGEGAVRNHIVRHLKTRSADALPSFNFADPEVINHPLYRRAATMTVDDIVLLTIKVGLQRTEQPIANVVWSTIDTNQRLAVYYEVCPTIPFEERPLPPQDALPQATRLKSMAKHLGLVSDLLEGYADQLAVPSALIAHPTASDLEKVLDQLLYTDRTIHSILSAHLDQLAPNPAVDP